MAQSKILVLLLLLVAASSTTLNAQNRSVRAELATMIEEVVAETGISINVSELRPTSANISQVNGRHVCSAEARADVERLQRAFDAHPNIHGIIGPTLITFTDRTGKKTFGDRQSLKNEGILKDCVDMYVSVHDE